MKILVLNLTVKNINRDSFSGSWCQGPRIGGAQVPPLNLLYVATLLNKLSGVDMDFCDAQADPFTFKQLRHQKDFNLVIFSTSFMSVEEDVSSIKIFKKNNPSLKIVAFGPHPTFLPEHTLSYKDIDIIVRFGPELILQELVRAMLNNKDWSNIKGIGFKENGQLKINSTLEQSENLDDLPFPDRSLLSPKANYFMPIVERTPFTTMLTSRGCPFSCTFCTTPVFEGKKTRSRSADNVFEELNILKNIGFKEVYFRDENFTFFKERNRLLFNKMIEGEVGLKWIANAHINTLDEEGIRLMKKSGCHYLKIGIESGSERILKIIKKNLDLKQVHYIFDLLRREGINTHANFMIGLPEEAEEDYLATLRLAKTLHPTTATFGICTPYPGTELFEKVRNEFLEILTLSPLHLRDLHIKQLLNERFSGLQKLSLDKYVRRAYYNFYMRPTYFFNTLHSIGNLNDLKRVCRAGFNVINFSLNIR